jgi:tripartite-type tricarboxylate transporter receptor subunit TctC
MLDRRSFLASGAMLALSPIPTLAQALGNARILTGFPPGGTVDVVARRVADKMRGAYAKLVLVENKPGAGGRLAVDELRRGAADGSSLLITPAAMVTLYPHLYPKLPYGLADVTPVAGVTSVCRPRVLLCACARFAARLRAGCRSRLVRGSQQSPDRAVAQDHHRAE